MNMPRVSVAGGVEPNGAIFQYFDKKILGLWKIFIYKIFFIIYNLYKTTLKEDFPSKLIKKIHHNLTIRLFGKDDLILNDILSIV